VKRDKTPLHTEEAYQAAIFAAQVDAIDLIEEYKKNPPKTSRDKALSENAIWLKVDPKYRNIIMDMKGYEAKWLAYVLADGGPCSPFKARARALKELRKGFNVVPAWEALDEGINPEHVYEAFTSASTAAKNAADGEAHQRFEQSLTESIVKPIRDRRPVSPKSISRRGGRSKLSRPPRQRPAPEQTETAIVAEPPRSRWAKPLDEMTTESKALWVTITMTLDKEIPAFVASRLNGLTEPSQIEDISDEFKLEVNACYQNLLGKIRNIRARGTSKEILNIKQSEIIEAAEILGFKAPSRSAKHYRTWRPDLELAKKAYLKLASRFHPDKNPDDDRSAQRFDSIQKAWNLLKSL